MITVACVEWANYLDRGAEYVAKLKSMVARHLTTPHNFVCLTDDPTRHPDLSYDEYYGLPVPNSSWAKDDFAHGLTGWWAKIYLFSPGRFTGRVLFLDLDTVIVGSLEKLAQSKGIIHLKDWGWTKNDYGSGAMVWDAGEHSEIWTQYNANVPHRFRGDQDYLTALGGWPALPKGLAVSYRYVSKIAPPDGAVAVCFHGTPRCHEVTTGWVPDYWR